jgi:hypothetical protein
VVEGIWTKRTSHGSFFGPLSPASGVINLVSRQEPCQLVGHPAPFPVCTPTDVARKLQYISP